MAAHTARRLALAAVAVSGVVALAGCGSSSSGTAAATTGATSSASTQPATTAAPATTSTSPAVTATSTGTTTGTGTTTTPAGAAAENLHVTDALRAQLVAAGAAIHNLPPSAYTGLEPGQTYYAYDPATGTYWAGAALVPSASSQAAQVSVQDDGSYLLFRRIGDGAWTVWSVGLAGTEGATCPVAVPASVLAVWDWAPGTCRSPV